MWRGLPRLRDLAAFDGWLYRITVNAAKMSLRRRCGVRELHLEPDMRPEATARPLGWLAAYGPNANRQLPGPRLRPLAPNGDRLDLDQPAAR